MNTQAPFAKIATLKEYFTKQLEIVERKLESAKADVIAHEAVYETVDKSQLRVDKINAARDHVQSVWEQVTLYQQQINRADAMRDVERELKKY